MAYYDSFVKWVDKTRKESKTMMESFADTCRNNKVFFFMWLIFTIFNIQGQNGDNASQQMSLFEFDVNSNLVMTV